jgi:diguanylate cyclase (GGDEF)-like protein
MKSFDIKSKLIISLSSLLLIVFIIISTVNYNVSKKSIRNNIIQDALPLISNNVYSELQRDLATPIHISSLMSNDTFVKDWILNGEKNVAQIQKYLNTIKKKYGFVSTFLVSDKTKNYYHFKGVHKKISRKNAHDVWYYNFIDKNLDYDLDVDNDEAANHELTIFINHRLTDPEGKLIGVTGVGLAMKDAGTMLKKYMDQHDKNIYLVDQIGLVQIHSEYSRIEKMNIFKTEGLQNIAVELLASKDEPVLAEYDHAGQHIIVISRYVPDFKWFVIVEQIENRALEEIRKNFAGNLAAGFLITIIVIMINIFTVNYFQSRLVEMATTDDLTGILNRRSFYELGEREFAAFKRFKSPLSIIVIDIDYFKSFNDNYGHHMGDLILAQFATTIKSLIREIDIFGRTGGEEFAIILPRTKIGNAVLTAERMRAAVEKMTIPGRSEKITISLGAAEADPSTDSLANLMEEGDRAMYRAKKEGRNRVCSG